MEAGNTVARTCISAFSRRLRRRHWVAVPEVGREHFERAIAVSEGRHLMARVMFASQYARLVFDRELHDQTLRDVLAANPRAPGLTLSNRVAQEQAQALLDSADEHFF